jgi:hypothetical protein
MSGAVLGVAVTFIVGEVKRVKSIHAQNIIALGGQVAKEACLLAEEYGAAQKWDGVQKLDKAVTMFNEKMTEAGFKVDIFNAQDTVQAAHTAMTYDKTTAYNDKTGMAPAGA